MQFVQQCAWLFTREQSNSSRSRISTSRLGRSAAGSPRRVKSMTNAREEVETRHKGDRDLVSGVIIKIGLTSNCAGCSGRIASLLSATLSSSAWR